MYLLRFSNCDDRTGYTEAKWDEKPTYACLKRLMIDYYDEELSSRIAKELLQCGEIDLDTSDSIHYELEQV